MIEVNNVQMRRIVQCLIMLLLSASAAYSQYVYDYRRTADIYYNAKDYYSAAQYYSKALGTFRIKPSEVLPYAVAAAGK